MREPNMEVLRRQHFLTSFCRLKGGKVRSCDEDKSSPEYIQHRNVSKIFRNFCTENNRE